MTSLQFAKVEGSGNDFILLDRRRKPFSGNPGAFARTWCDRKRGIGADGLLMALPSAKADARMRIFNSDGSEAEMCGNGLRCLAWYLYNNEAVKPSGAASSGRSRGGKKTLSVDTRAGLMRAQITGKERVRFTLSRPKSLRLGLRLRHAGKSYLLHSVNSGVPHAVLLSSHLKKADLKTLGPAIRHHRLFQPAGTNVNVMQVHSPHRISIRTYERGVEDETLACGTGAVASVVIGTALGRLRPPVDVKTPGGEILSVGFRPSRQPWEGLYLEGPARILFEGEVRT